MLNHSLSFATLTQYEVDLIGYRGSNLPDEVRSNKKIRTRYLSTSIVDYIKRLPKVLYLVYAILRIVIQIIQLLFVLMSRQYDYIIVQNPPCVPLFFVIILVKMMKCGRTKLIIDWHNYGYSIMRVNRVNKMLVFLAKIYEKHLGRWGDYNLCVSKAMKTDLIH
jgi:beta-1,4-mannosyltransferase